MREKQKDAASGSHQTNVEKQDDKQSRWPLLLTVLLIGSLVTSYFILPGFESALNEGWQVLTSGDEERISKWVSQFGFWGPFFIVLAMIAQMFLLVINVAHREKRIASS